MKDSYKNIFTLHSRKGLLSVFLLFNTIIMLLLSHDSYLYYQYNRYDSSLFYMCGKAWMNGMTPYVDFADSKGPLTWIIYGIGYLLSPTNYHGVFWLSVIFVTVSTFYLYKIAELYICHSKAFIASLLTTLAMFCPIWHDETRAETFAWPFLTSAIYYTLKNADFNNNITAHKHLQRDTLLVGICLGATLMIKFTIPFMLLPCVCYTLYISVKIDKPVKTAITMACGILLICMPFILYFASQGILGNAIHEYFITTTSTDQAINNGDIFSVFRNYISCFYALATNYDHSGSVLLYLAIIPTISLCIKQENDTPKKYLPLIIHAWMLCICTFRSKVAIYYFEPCTPLFIFTCLFIIERFNFNIKCTKHVIFATVPIALIGSLIFIKRDKDFKLYSYYSTELTEAYKKENNAFQTLEHYLGAVKHPKIMIFDLQLNEEGVGTFSEALPSNKYWFPQVGLTLKMYEDRKNAIINKKPDFILGKEIDQELLEFVNEGYEVVYVDSLLPFKVYTKKTLKLQ